MWKEQGWGTQLGRVWREPTEALWRELGLPGLSPACRFTVSHLNRGTNPHWSGSVIYKAHGRHSSLASDPSWKQVQRVSLKGHMSLAHSESR